MSFNFSRYSRIIKLPLLIRQLYRSTVRRIVESNVVHTCKEMILCDFNVDVNGLDSWIQSVYPTFNRTKPLQESPGRDEKNVTEKNIELLCSVEI